MGKSYNFLKDYRRLALKIVKFQISMKKLKEFWSFQVLSHYHSVSHEMDLVPHGIDTPEER